jgi:hypothetical protein
MKKHPLQVQVSMYDADTYYSMTHCHTAESIKFKQQTPCHMLSSGWFPGICSLNANVSEHSVPLSQASRYKDGTDSVFWNVGI